MMKRTQLLVYSLFLGVAMQSSAFAEDVKADVIREQFARSRDSKLELAADALGDEGILELFQTLKKSHALSPSVLKKIERSHRP